jgi:hypothetical protein
VLGPDHFTSPGAATALILALGRLDEAEPACALGEDTLQRCRRMLGPDHTVTLLAATALTVALVRLGEVEPARILGQETLKRCRRVLGLHHPITLYLTEVAGTDDRILGGDDADRARRPQ